ncbi:MAG: hypothetical protein JSR61_00075 [Proteobacteria bacterium]|nr:hypothetical protein [Pseudomonadota bacterium]
MKWRWLAMATLVLVGGGLVATDPALARKGNKARVKYARCHDALGGPTWRGIWFNTEPRPNGCSPAVFQYGRFIGQDPDSNIRFQLMRDPETGYTVSR